MFSLLILLRFTLFFIDMPLFRCHPDDMLMLSLFAHAAYCCHADYAISFSRFRFISLFDAFIIDCWWCALIAFYAMPLLMIRPLIFSPRPWLLLPLFSPIFRRFRHWCFLHFLLTFSIFDVAAADVLWCLLLLLLISCRHAADIFISAMPLIIVYYFFHWWYFRCLFSSFADISSLLLIFRCYFSFHADVAILFRHYCFIFALFSLFIIFIIDGPLCFRRLMPFRRDYIIDTPFHLFTFRFRWDAAFRCRFSMPLIFAFAADIFASFLDAIIFAAFADAVAICCHASHFADFFFRCYAATLSCCRFSPLISSLSFFSLSPAIAATHFFHWWCFIFFLAFAMPFSPADIDFLISLIDCRHDYADADAYAIFAILLFWYAPLCHAARLFSSFIFIFIFDDIFFHAFDAIFFSDYAAIDFRRFDVASFAFAFAADAFFSLLLMLRPPCHAAFQRFHAAWFFAMPLCWLITAAALSLSSSADADARWYAILCWLLLWYFHDLLDCYTWYIDAADIGFRFWCRRWIRW